MKRINADFEKKSKTLLEGFNRTLLGIAEKHIEERIRNQWIEKKEQEPKYDMSIITIDMNHGNTRFKPAKCFHYTKKCNIEFTHWMPLPKYPRYANVKKDKTVALESSEKA